MTDDAGINADDVLADLRDRLARAESELRSMAMGSTSPAEIVRLGGKRQGVALARSYVDEALQLLFYK